MRHNHFLLTELPDIIRERDPKLAARHDAANGKLQQVDERANTMLEQHGVWAASRLVKRWAQENPGVAITIEAGWFVGGAAGITAALNERAHATATVIGREPDLEMAATWRLAALVSQRVGVEIVESKAWELVAEMVGRSQRMDLSDAAVVAASAEGICAEAGLDEPLP